MILTHTLEDSSRTLVQRDFSLNRKKGGCQLCGLLLVVCNLPTEFESKALDTIVETVGERERHQKKNYRNTVPLLLLLHY